MLIHKVTNVATSETSVQVDLKELFDKHKTGKDDSREAFAREVASSQRLQAAYGVKIEELDRHAAMSEAKTQYVAAVAKARELKPVIEALADEAIADPSYDLTQALKVAFSPITAIQKRVNNGELVINDAARKAQVLAVKPKTKTTGK